ncbi:hypothetical protein HJG60_009885 [Phyllostomus discolor]|uniref:Uncharacterized protein n=1 Tax=Phyllostomus discolor TaxID=89673 RepID=A0A834B2U1_9CHIR|nr:hypothetical protein HJG60_009885 [Phyllostomus discolor]
MSTGGQQLYPQGPSPSRMGLSGVPGRCASSRLPRLTFDLGGRPQQPCGLWLQSSPQNPGSPIPSPKASRPIHLQHCFLGSQPGSASCRPRPGLLPTAEAAVPARAGGQCHCSLSILLGPGRTMRQPGPREPDIGVQATFCTGELLAFH